MCVYILTEQPVKSSLGHAQRQCFNLYWMANQPYVTGQELTGNQCIQPPILHQYSVSLSRHKPAPLAVFSLSLLSLFFFFFSSLFSSHCASAVCFFESHSISILRTSLFLCFVFKWSGSQAGGCSSEEVGKEGKRGGKSAFRVKFLPSRSLWGDDSWRNAPLIPLTRVTWPLGSVTLRSNLNRPGGQQREKNAHL